MGEWVGGSVCVCVSGKKEDAAKKAARATRFPEKPKRKCLCLCVCVCGGGGGGGDWGGKGGGGGGGGTVGL